MNLFTNIFKPLTTLEESKADISIYSTQLWTCGAVFTRMAYRTIEFSFANRVKALNGVVRASKLLCDCDEIWQLACGSIPIRMWV